MKYLTEPHAIIRFGKAVLIQITAKLADSIFKYERFKINNCKYLDRIINSDIIKSYKN